MIRKEDFIGFDTKEPVKNISNYHYSYSFDCDSPLVAEEINIPLDEFKCYDNWYLIDGEYYFFKYKYAFIELFVSELFKEFKLRTPSYSLATIDDKNIGILSRNFRKRNSKYEELDDYAFRRCKMPYSFEDTKNPYKLFEYKEAFDKSLSSCTAKNLYDKLSTLFALDFFTGQTDRYGYNLLVETSSKNNSTLAPITDNGYSFNPEVSYITGCLGFVRYPHIEEGINETNYSKKDSVRSTVELLLNNVTYRKTIERLLGINIKDILKRTLERYRILISEEQKRMLYKYFDEKKSCMENGLELSMKVSRIK